jgi:predicted nucleic acid-binding protein
VKPTILLDTGPLVAFLSRQDNHHRWAKEQINQSQSPLLTCEPVITETCFLLRRLLGSSDAVFEFMQAGALQLAFNLADELDAVRKLMAHYADVPMSLADACLVRMSELYSDSVVLTTDSDFNVYRRNRRQIIPTLMPPSGQ